MRTDFSYEYFSTSSLKRIGQSAPRPELSILQRGFVGEKKKKKKGLIIWFSSAAPLLLPSGLRLKLRLFTRHDRANSSRFKDTQSGGKNFFVTLLFFLRRASLSLPSASPLLSTGTGRGTRRPGSSGWMPVWSAGSSRSPAGSVCLRPGRTPPVAGRRRRTMPSTRNRTGERFGSVYSTFTTTFNV